MFLFDNKTFQVLQFTPIYSLVKSFSNGKTQVQFYEEPKSIKCRIIMGFVFKNSSKHVILPIFDWQGLIDQGSFVETTFNGAFYVPPLAAKVD